MPDSAAKKTGDPVRVLRKTEGEPAIEDDWLFVRFEPDSGDLIAEKDGKRIVCPREEFENLNFPGSSGLWETVSENGDEEALNEARRAWASLDLAKTASCLLKYCRTVDPAFTGCQTAAEFAAKARSSADSCANALVLLRIELKRAEAEYNRCPNETSFQNDQKDTTRLYCHDKLVPAWCHLAACLESIEAARKSR
jgi:hypothetical protein